MHNAVAEWSKAGMELLIQRELTGLLCILLVEKIRYEGFVFLQLMWIK